jgi:hypothetical protein
MSPTETSIAQFPAPEPFALNPHLEPHGHHAVEWSYHFPLRKNCTAKAELKLRFPAEKSSAAARHSAMQSTISHTRFSLAGASADAARLSQQLHKDSLWIRDRLCPNGNPHCGVKDLENSPILLRFGSNYFSMGFLSRLTLMLQSTLKLSARAYTRKLDAIADHLSSESEDETFFTLANVITVAVMTVESALIWKSLLASCRSHAEYKEPETPSLLENFCAETSEVSELILGLIGKCLADAQDATERFVAKCATEDSLSSHKERVLNKRRQLIKHTEKLCDLRSEFRLPTIEMLSEDPETAEKYYERSLEIKRNQYRKWELETHLKPENRKLDFWISAAASAMASVASLFTKLTKERVKSLFKLNIHKYLNTQNGRWVGTCSFIPPKFEVDANTNPTSSSPLCIERRLWWTKDGDDWVFRIKEQFTAADLSAKLPSHTLKQIWRLPFDEILTTMDDSTHTIRLPSTDGKPRQIRVLKRTSIPYSLRIVTQDISNKMPLTIDEVKLNGHILLAGAHITRVTIQ